jgi:hypothetical protein
MIALLSLKYLVYYMIVYDKDFLFILVATIIKRFHCSSCEITLNLLRRV